MITSTTIHKTVTTIHKTTGTVADLLKEPALCQEAEIVIHIPGGGDWSNMTVEPRDLTFTATYTEIEELT